MINRRFSGFCSHVFFSSFCPQVSKPSNFNKCVENAQSFTSCPHTLYANTSTHCEASSCSQYSHHLSRKMLRSSFSWRISSLAQDSQWMSRAHTRTYTYFWHSWSTSNENVNPSISVPFRCKGECGRPDLSSSRCPTSLKSQTCRLTCQVTQESSRVVFWWF